MPSSRFLLRKVILTLIFVIINILNVCHAQSWSDIKSNPNMYYYGEGFGESLKEADDQALATLISQISVNISVNTVQDNKRVEKDGRLVSDNTMFKASIETFSTATLTNTNRIEIESAPNSHVVRWIKRDEVDKIWDSRRNKIHEMIDAAVRAEEKGKVDVALRNYYWALTLVKSMQKSNSEQYEGRLLTIWIPEQIENILGDLIVTIADNNGDGDVELLFTYKNKPVNSLDFKYSDGGFWSNLCSVKDGYGLMQMTPGEIYDKYELEIEFEYRSQARLDPELASVLALTPEYKFKSASFEIRDVNNESNRVNGAPVNSIARDFTILPSDNSASTTSFTGIESQFFEKPSELSVIPENCLAYMELVKNAIKSKKYNLARECFTDSCYKIYNKLIKYGQAKIIGEEKMTFYQNGEFIWGKGLKLSFSFNKGARKNFTEDVVFTFDNDGKISNLAFGLGETAEDDIMGQSAYPERARMILLDFLQNYQTAFALKRIDYINQIFDEDALIIVANKLRPSKSSIRDVMLASLGEQYEYHRYTKNEYMAKLEQSFNSKEYINLRFNDTKVRRSSVGGEIYGIQLEQDYFSNNYSDHGYLFLEINLNNPEEPLIFVRTWQPNPDPEFGLYGLDSFKIQQIDQE